MNVQMKNEIINLVEKAKTVYVSSVDGSGHPNTKAMLSLHHNNLFEHYLSTNLSSRRAQQFIKNQKACIYFCNENEFQGLMLVGEIQVKTDLQHKTMLWRDGFEIYYPQGIDTEDYCVLKFIGYKANYYHGLDNTDFIMEDFDNAKF